MDEFDFGGFEHVVFELDLVRVASEQPPGTAAIQGDTVRVFEVLPCAEASDLARIPSDGTTHLIIDVSNDTGRQVELAGTSFSLQAAFVVGGTVWDPVIQPLPESPSQVPEVLDDLVRRVGTAQFLSGDRPLARTESAEAGLVALIDAAAGRGDADVLAILDGRTDATLETVPHAALDVNWVPEAGPRTHRGFIRATTPSGSTATGVLDTDDRDVRVTALVRRGEELRIDVWGAAATIENGGAPDLTLSYRVPSKALASIGANQLLLTTGPPGAPSLDAPVDLRVVPYTLPTDDLDDLDDPGAG